MALISVLSSQFSKCSFRNAAVSGAIAWFMGRIVLNANPSWWGRIVHGAKRSRRHLVSNSSLNTRWTAISNTWQHTYIHCTHNIWWLVIGWATTKEDNPNARSDRQTWTYGGLTLLHLIVYRLVLWAMHPLPISEKAWIQGPVFVLLDCFVVSRPLVQIPMPSQRLEVYNNNLQC